MIFLTFGTGMGAGLILDGKLYSGTCGTAGEVGHIRLDADGPAAYGKAGSFEGFCSGAGIASMAKKMLSIYSGTTIIPRDNVTAKTIADAAIKGDKLANAIYRRCGEKLGLGVSILIDILNVGAVAVLIRHGHTDPDLPTGNGRFQCSGPFTDADDLFFPDPGDLFILHLP